MAHNHQVEGSIPSPATKPISVTPFFKQHFARRKALYDHLMAELAIPGVRCCAYFEEGKGYVCESAHPRACKCGACR